VEASVGTWAAGNFDSDAALDLVEHFAETVREEIAKPVDVGDLEEIMAAVSVLKVLVEHCHASAPDTEEIDSLRDAILEVYDEQIDGLEPHPDYKRDRRRTIVGTFDDFTRLVQEKRSRT
jgi:hypothetical protein